MRSIFTKSCNLKCQQQFGVIVTYGKTTTTNPEMHCYLLEREDQTPYSFDNSILSEINAVLGFTAVFLEDREELNVFRAGHGREDTCHVPKT